MIVAFSLLISIPAMAAGWTNWFTIDSLGYDFYKTDAAYAFAYVIPDGTVENPDLCGSSSQYVLAESHNTATVAASNNAKESSKLPTLAYTAGWQVRLYLNGCQFGFPHAYAVEIKKP